ncbi:hypothetical protein DD237_008542 [Peronospora effusa]|uniref:Uncharacterized protein n=1 Tax=Peronospora effusa TaxID=542832 RepID=A0A425CN29_9STRA|nr:hypothetical protein DD237_008542 [Peronospora effusa]
MHPKRSLKLLRADWQPIAFHGGSGHPVSSHPQLPFEARFAWLSPSVVQVHLQLARTSVLEVGDDAEVARAQVQTAERRRQSCPNRFRVASESQTADAQTGKERSSRVPGAAYSQTTLGHRRCRSPTRHWDMNLTRSTHAKSQT